MSAAEILKRLRRFLLLLALLLFLGTLVELWLVNHTEDAVQWLPFVLVGLSIVAILFFIFNRGRKSILFVRITMLLTICGSLLGIYLHVSNNVAFEREIHPNSSTTQLIKRGLGGANPLLAPGTLAVAGLLALAAIYKEPVDASKVD